MDYSLRQGAANSASYILTGLDCGDCAARLEDHLGSLGGIREARVNFGAATLEVVYEEGAARPDVPAAVAGLGYQARPRDAQAPRPTWKTRRRILATVLSGLAFAGGLVAEWLLPGCGTPGAPCVAGAALPTLLFAFAVATGGFYMARAALIALRTSKGLDINFLMTVAVAGALALGRWEEAAEVVCLFSAGNALAAATMDRTRAALRGLLSLAPALATVREGHRELKRGVADVAVGDVLLVRPGERIPLDGTVIGGRSALDESALTGEATPAAKGPGDPVYAGSLNGRGALEIRVTSKTGDSVLARIVHLVEEAQSRRAPIQQVVDRFARLYTPLILVLAGLIAVVPWLLGWPDHAGWVYQALALLVVSCPCALVVSTPVAVAAAIASASRKGLLIKGGAFLEALGTVAAVAFDKTGTLTAGRPAVTDLVAHNGLRPDELLAVAAALEHRSEHPLAEAILRKHREVGQESCCDGCSSSRGTLDDRDGLLVVEDFEAFPGLGVAGRMNGRHLYVGNPPFMVDRGVPIREAEATLEEWRQAGKTPILIGEPGKLLGLLAIADAPREGAAGALAALRRAGIRHIALLTGDHHAVAEPIGRKLGADEVMADLLPADKVRAVRDLMRRHGRVAMIGDGINDAPALATATVGVAMGVRGTGVALETADVVLMHDDLRLLAPALRLGREAVTIIRQNIAFAIAVKVLLVALAIPHMLTLGMAVMGDVGTTLLVILNGMRLLRARALNSI